MTLTHESNLVEKESRKPDQKYGDPLSQKYLAEIRIEYDKWHSQNEALIGPLSNIDDADAEIIQRRVELTEEYKNFIDQQVYAEHFDSRSNLHSSVIEQFLYYLFRDLVADRGENALLGRSHAFKDLFFMPPSFTAMLQAPYARIEKKDHDFVIGARVQTTFQTFIEQPPEELRAQVLPEEVHIFDIPAIAIECKTYLDKTMLEGSSRAGEELKARNPNVTYLVVCEWLKLTEAVNLKKYKVDEIYVLRRQRNTDREYRYLPGYDKKPIHQDVVSHLFNKVRDRLTRDWEATIADGLERGWLVSAE